MALRLAGGTGGGSQRCSCSCGYWSVLAVLLLANKQPKNACALISYMSCVVVCKFHTRTRHTAYGLVRSCLMASCACCMLMCFRVVSLSSPCPSRGWFFVCVFVQTSPTRHPRVVGPCVCRRVRPLCLTRVRCLPRHNDTCHNRRLLLISGGG